MYQVFAVGLRACVLVPEEKQEHASNTTENLVAFKLSGKIYCLSCSMAACLCAPFRHLFCDTRTHTAASALTTGEHWPTTICPNEENRCKEKSERVKEEEKQGPTLWADRFRAEKFEEARKREEAVGRERDRDGDRNKRMVGDWRFLSTQWLAVMWGQCSTSHTWHTVLRNTFSKSIFFWLNEREQHTTFLLSLGHDPTPRRSCIACNQYTRIQNIVECVWAAFVGACAKIR